MHLKKKMLRDFSRRYFCLLFFCFVKNDLLPVVGIKPHQACKAE